MALEAIFMHLAVEKLQGIIVYNVPLDAGARADFPNTNDNNTHTGEFEVKSATLQVILQQVSRLV